MSEIPYLPLRQRCDNLKLDNGIYYLSNAQVVAPFTMLEVTNEQHFSDHAVNEHIFVSRQPLFDNCYWFFDIGANNVININNHDEPYFFQGDNILSDLADVSFYFFKTNAPLYISRVNRQFKEYPFTYPSLQFITGQVPGVDIIDQSDQNVLLTNDDLAVSLNSDDLAKINQVRLQQKAGLQGGI